MGTDDPETGVIKDGRMNQLGSLEFSKTNQFQTSFGRRHSSSVGRDSSECTEDSSKHEQALWFLLSAQPLGNSIYVLPVELQVTRSLDTKEDKDTLGNRNAASTDSKPRLL